MEYQVPEDHLSTSQSWKEYCWHELFVVLVTIIKKHSILRNHILLICSLPQLTFGIPAL